MATHYLQLDICQKPESSRNALTPSHSTLCRPLRTRKICSKVSEEVSWAKRTRFRCAPKGHHSTRVDSTRPSIRAHCGAGWALRFRAALSPKKAIAWHPVFVWLGPRSFYLWLKGGPKPYPNFQPCSSAYAQAFFRPKAGHPSSAHGSCARDLRSAPLARPAERFRDP